MAIILSNEFGVFRAGLASMRDVDAAEAPADYSRARHARQVSERIWARVKRGPVAPGRLGI